MIDVNSILKKAEELGASDAHFITGNKPMLRIHRDLIPVEGSEILTEQDQWEVYDYFLAGNVDKDKYFKDNKILDCSAVFGDIRLRVNISLSDAVPVITTRLIRKELPTYEELGVPDIVRRMTEQTQGLILVTGKTNSGKSTTLNALINYINETQNKKILTLESPVEYKHESKKSIIIQKEVGTGGDIQTYSQGTKNSLREDCDILVIGEIRDRITMDAAIETAESGHLVIGTLHTKSCAETIDRMINFYDVKDQTTQKYLIASLLKLVISQRLLKNKKGTLSLVPEVMVVDNVISGVIRKDKLSVSEIEDAIQSNSSAGNIGLINSLAELYADDILTQDTVRSQIEEKNIEIFNRTVKQLKLRKEAEKKATYVSDTANQFSGASSEPSAFQQQVNKNPTNNDDTNQTEK